MIRARGLLRAGSSAADAARATGLTKGAISSDAVCSQIVAEYKSKKMRQVDKLVGHGVTVKGACAEFDVTPNSYYVWRKRNAAKTETAPAAG
jgi:hypothetical protein